MSVRAKFLIAAEASVDSKMTVVRLKRIQVSSEAEIYSFPNNAQTPKDHQKLFETAIMKNDVKSLKTRGQFRNLNVTLSEELAALYFDSEGNVQFNGEYLDQITDQKQINPVTLSSEVIERKTKSLHSITKDFVLDKFSGKNQNAKLWLETFIRECVRMEVLSNSQQIDDKIIFRGSPH